MAEHDAWTAKLVEIERTVETHFRHNPIDEANARLRQATEAHNARVAETNAAAEQRAKALEERGAEISEMDGRIATLDRQLQEAQAEATKDAERLAAYNHRVDERNTLARQRSTAAAEHNQAVAEYNRWQQEAQQESQRRRDDLQALEKKEAERAAAYSSWVEGGGPERFWIEVNALYATLRDEMRRRPESAPALGALVNRLQAARRDLASYALDAEASQTDGLLLVRARLGDDEDCCLLVDAGASTVTVSPEMVRALGWEDYQGDNTTLRLAGGFRTTAPQLLVPAISYKEHKAELVRGVALAAPEAGVDGALGLSFLNRFDYKITRDAKTSRPELHLEERRRVEGEPAFDVFISHRTPDLAAARQVFDRLSERGYAPFLAPVSLARTGQAEFLTGIDDAIENARHLVLVGSSAEYMMAPYVRMEWQMFRNLSKLGRKPRGNIVIVLCGSMQPQQLPTPLSVYHAIPISDPGWCDQLVGFLPT